MVRQGTLTASPAFRLREPAEEPAPATEPADAPEEVAWPEEPASAADTSLTIPGRGERPADCGDYLPLKYCPSCGRPHMLEHRCKGRRCPNCENIWTGERAEVATVRLEAARLSEPDGWRRRAVHAVVSAPEDWGSSLDAYRRGARRANRLAKEHGIRGGAVIPHGFRVKESVKEEYREIVGEEEATESGLWSWLKEEYEGSRWRSAVYYSPHYHVVGLAEDVTASSPEADGGWVVSNIRSLESVNRGTDKSAHEDVYGLFYYLLSHTSFDPNGSGHTVRWFGEYAYCNFSPEEAVPRTTHRAIENTVARIRESGVEELDPHKCEEGCETILEPIREAGDKLQSRAWCEEIGAEAERELEAALAWVRSDRPPPPGLRHPRSEAAAREALGELVSGVGEAGSPSG